jgi:hypothetical protein
MIFGRTANWQKCEITLYRQRNLPKILHDTGIPIGESLKVNYIWKNSEPAGM